MPLQFAYDVGLNDPKIISITPLDNDLDSVLFALRTLESRIKTMGVYDYESINNVSLGYLRSLNVNYSDEGDSYMGGVAWRMFAGLQEPIQNSFHILR